MVDLNLIKKIREATGCGIADCNKALAECNNNYDEAVDWLRKKGLSSAAKKSSRITTEGLVGVMIEGKKAVMVEVNSETDFVAKNDRFQELVKHCLEAGFNVKNSDNYVEDLKNQVINGEKIADELTNKIAVIGENLQIRRGKTFELNGNGALVSYIHNATNANCGKIGVLVALKSEGNVENLNKLGKEIAMHIAAAKPDYLNKEQVPTEALEREKSVLAEQAKASGKPQNIIEKMMEGRIKKFYEENCLLEQTFMLDDKMKINDLLKNFEKENGKSVEVQEYCLYILGEGMEKKENNFAEEVASMTK